MRFPHMQKRYSAPDHEHIRTRTRIDQGRRATSRDGAPRGRTKGLRYTELHERLVEALPGVPPATIAGVLSGMGQDLPPDVTKPSRGYYLHAKYAAPETKQREAEGAPPNTRIRENNFYQPFADWLVSDLEECTRAVSLGGCTRTITTRGYGVETIRDLARRLGAATP